MVSQKTKSYEDRTSVRGEPEPLSPAHVGMGVGMGETPEAFASGASVVLGVIG